MQRYRPTIFASQKTRDRFQRYWPYGIGFVAALLYGWNPRPFEEILSTIFTRARRPFIKATEFMEAQAETAAIILELPPDQHFGPLCFSDQLRFLLQALEADNELADNYLTRLCLDTMDLSIDPPRISEQEFLAAQGQRLVDFALCDFTDQRPKRRNKFFKPDAFLRFMNWVAAYPKIAEYIVQQCNGVELVFQALEGATEDYARLFAMRALMLYSFVQKNDGDIERRILQADGMKDLIDCYHKTTGDPTDTRFVTLLLSSLLRHYPMESTREFLGADGFKALLRNVNVTRYKGAPQHLRVLEDLYALPASVKEANHLQVSQEVQKAEGLPVLLGLLDVFPEYNEIVDVGLNLIARLLHDQAVKPFDLLEYRFLKVGGKLLNRYQTQPQPTQERTVALLLRQICDDPQCAPYLSSTGEVVEDLKRIYQLLEPKAK